MIKRRYVHLFFVLLATCLLCAILYQWYQLTRDRQITTALHNVPEILNDDKELPVKARVRNYPEVRLAIASALSKGRNLAKVESMLSELIETHDSGPVAAAARFNLANAYLRQAQSADETAAKTRPLLELAKQRYRDLLRKNPAHWGARHNLELALRLAPDMSTYASDEKNDPIKRVRVVVPGFEKKDLP